MRYFVYFLFFLLIASSAEAGRKKFKNQDNKDANNRSLSIAAGLGFCFMEDDNCFDEKISFNGGLDLYLGGTYAALCFRYHRMSWECGSIGLNMNAFSVQQRFNFKNFTLSAGPALIKFGDFGSYNLGGAGTVGGMTDISKDFSFDGGITVYHDFQDSEFYSYFFAGIKYNL